ncbi:MAG: condensation domain-containing protein, partial [Psychrosphaera sp.]|nr:condensation domain-containing protein [Psychrosphaera sp.]
TNNTTFASDTLVSDIKTQLQDVLPSHMVPAHFVVLDAIPLTANGKVDKKALPAPDSEMLLGDFVAPTTDTHNKLVAIWAQLLKVEQHKLGITANFFESGGDSILSIQMVARAAGVGINVTVKQLFEYPTIELLASQALQNVRIDRPQGPVSGEVDLLPIQHQFFLDEIDLHHFNQSVMLTTPATFNPDWLQDVVEQLLLRHDALRLCFEKINGVWCAQHRVFNPTMMANMVEQSIVVVDDFAQLTQIADTQQASLSLLDGPLFKAVYFANGAEQGRLLFICHHLVVDGVSWRILLSDIESLCHQLGQREALSLPPKTSSVQQWGAFMADYAKSESLMAQRDYWLEAVSQPVTPLPQSPSSNTGLGLQRFELDETTTTALLQRAGLAYRTQINELLLAGLLLGFNHWSENSTNSHTNKSIRIDLEGHGREALDETIDLSQTVGWFTSMYPLTLSCDYGSDGNRADLQSLICAVKEQVRAIPNRGIGFGLLKYLNREEALLGAPKAEIAFNYLGQFDQSMNNDNYLTPASESTGNGMSTLRELGHSLTFNGAVSEGRLSFDIRF